MKCKSRKHKETNIFKFQPFAERISNVDVDIFHRVGHEYETTDEEISCHFYQTLQKWTVLNLTNNFNTFRHEVTGIVTLPQLLHKKDHVIETLLKHLKARDALYLQPLLELVVALAKDLRKDFYPYYIAFLNQLIEILNTKDTDVVEWTFQCLAYLFKFLWRYLIKDINNVLKSLLPLLANNKPEYINNFAAESFAFVARKVRDRKSFLILILKLVKKEPDAINGCGRLLFEVIKGVHGQFHSCAEEILPFYFDSLADNDCSQEQLFQLLEQLTYNIIKNINAKKSQLFWNSILKTIDTFTNRWQIERTSTNQNNIELILDLFGKSIEYRDGKLLLNADVLVEKLAQLVKIDFPDKIYMLITQISAVILLNTQIILGQEYASKLTIRILALPSKQIIFNFVTNVISAPSFEILILPTFLEHCVKERLNDDVLRILTQIVLTKSPPRLNGFTEWRMYALDFPVTQQITNEYDIVEHFLKIINMEALVTNENENFDKALCALICLPHLKNINKTEVIVHLKKFITNVCTKITEERNTDNSNIHIQNSYLFLLAICVDSISHLIMDNNEIDDLLTIIIDTTIPYLNDSKFLSALQILDILLSACSQKMITFTLLERLNEFLIPNISSPFHEIRRLTTHIYSLFENIPELNEIKTENDETWKIFSYSFHIESIEPTVNTYREQIQYLNYLHIEKPQASLYKHTNFKTYPLRYLLGVLYVNFKLLWKPTIDIIASHAEGLDIIDFWDIFYNQLVTVEKYCKSPPDVELINIQTQCDFLNKFYQKIYKLMDKPDFINYRILLWNCMAQVPDVVHVKNRDITPIFLQFINDEYLSNNSELAKTWNIKKNDEKSDLMEVDDDLENNTQVQNIGTKIPFKRKLQTLLACLELFSKIQNPKNMYRETELYNIYLELLKSKNAEVQKAALDCIMAYKHKYLTPYKEHLYNLINDKQTKNELALFRIDTESEILLPEHRKDFIPIILRIVYSKMTAKTGMRTGGKGGGQLKRSLVIRFLSGCHEDELMIFVEMAFKIYTSLLCDNSIDLIRKIETTVDLENIIPPKKLQSSINLLGIVLEKFGAISSDKLLPYLLKILICIGAIIKSIFSRIDLVHEGYLNSLKLLRTSAIQNIARFFEHFESYEWTQTDIQAVFEVFVWPMLDKLPIEGIHSPTALMKLFMCWGQNPRYFILLATYPDNDPDKYALPYILQLLLNPKTHITVTNAILEILEKLLTLQPSEDEMSVPQIPVVNYIKTNKQILNKLSLKERLNFGSIILLGHIPKILDYLQNKIGSKHKNINKKELLILSRISELIWESETSNNLLKLLAPIIVRKINSGTDDETIIHLTSTLCNLIQNVSEPLEHLLTVGPLFGKVVSVPARKLLCNFLQLIEQKCNDGGKKPEFAKIINIIIDLNAWDTKWIDQPNFEKRLRAFKDVQSLIDNKLLDCTFGAIIIHNCYFTIRNESDLSLNDNASDCLKSVAAYLIKKYQCNQQYNEFIINNTILKLIWNGMLDKNDKIRTASISLLGHVARECPAGHIILTDLHKLTNKVDMEVDFFENLQHLQLHRHVRGLLKFCQVAKTLTKSFHPRTLIQFILPLASQYLCCEKYLGKNTIVDAAIEVVATVCRMLPWHQYEGILKLYLNKLRHKIEYQKQLVRIVIGILDAFHYDLSRANLNTASLVQLNEEKKHEEITDENAGNVEEKEKTEDEAAEELEELLKDDTLIEEQPVVNTETKELTVFEKQTVLSPSAARRLIFSITKVLLPQLHKVISQMTPSEHSHKLNKKRTRTEKEEEDILRVPIALAVVKLLQKLPEQMLESNLPGIFMKICTFLKSHLESVRRITREILEKIMITLGPKYLNLLLNEITPLMTKGFQVHVLVYTTHSVLAVLKEQYKPGDLDCCLETILKLCMNDIFGIIADEKEINQIIAKTSEAKSTKSYDTFQILSQFITEKCLMDLILPLKNILSTTFTYKKVHKAEECLRRIAIGVIDNEFITTESLLIFAYGVASQSIPELQLDETKNKSETEKNEKPLQRRSDCFIIPQEPKNKLGELHRTVRNAASSNAHILIDFGIRLCYILLKKERLKDNDYRTYLDPFVPILLDCLKSRHVKLCTLIFNCLGWIFKMDLPSLKANIKEFAMAIFNLLHKYAVAGLAKGDNFDLVSAAFKAMAVLVRDVNYFVLDTDQLKTLLLYIEQDLHDHDRQATAFSLLKAIITRKLIVKEIHEIMGTVAKISITSEMSHVRLQARQVFFQFLMDYPLSKRRLEKHILFYLSQLNFQLQFGRESALEMILSLIKSFPMNVLNDQSSVFFVTLGTRLVNDDSPECRKAAADCIKTMLMRLYKKERDKLMEVVVTWLQGGQLSHRRLAAQLCGLVVVVEKEEFETRLDKLIPILLVQLLPNVNNVNEPGRFVRITNEDSETIDDDNSQRVRDHLLFQVLQLLLKLCSMCPNFLRRTEDIENFATYAQTLLAYPHLWVRLAAAQFIGYVMTTLKINNIAQLYLTGKTKSGYLSSDPKNTIKSLTLDLCAQLQVENVNEELTEQVVKNLIFIARILKEIPISKTINANNNDEGGNVEEPRINLLWLIKRLRKVVFAEVSQTPNVYILREAVFRWIGGIARMFTREQLSPVLYHLMAPLVREISTDNTSATIKQLAKEVANELKKRVGNDMYTETLSKLQMKLNVKRATRKRERAQLAITNPDIAAKRKIKLHEKKKQLKKRKIANIKENKYVKKKKRKLDMNDD